MKIALASLVLCVSLSFASCSKESRPESTNPEQDIVGNWKVAKKEKYEYNDLVELQLRATGECMYREYIHPPSGYRCSYKLVTGGSGNELLLTLIGDPMMGTDNEKHRYKLQVYKDELILTAGQKIATLNRAIESPR